MNTLASRPDAVPPDMVRTERLTFGYPGRALGKGISVRLRRGELAGLVGANGAGKSTLLRTLAGLHPPLGGRILIGGNGKPEAEIAGLDSNSLARRISIVLTERVDSEDLTGRDLVSLGRYPYTGWDGKLNEEDERCVDWALEAVGAIRLAACSLRRMSDGERQKVMIARALAQETEVIILDEPTAFLDYPHRVEIMQTLKQLAHRRRKAVLFSTHDLDLALRSVDTLWALGAGNLETGAPEDLILNGSLEKVFRHAGETPSGLVFDRRSGAFQFEMPDGPGIYLSGHGISAAWTMRALQREGYRIARRGRGGEAAALEIEVRNGDSERLWLVSERGENENNARTEAGVLEFRSIADMMAYMKRRFTPGS